VAFDVAVLRSDVTRMAPDPQAMALAVEKLGVGAGRSVVVADTPVAADAARRAGLPVLAFPGRMAESEPELFGSLPMAHALSPEALTRAWRGAVETAAE
jgi:beta-phosphoglucomutase-like phosphatase (HAD superfamily)